MGMPNIESGTWIASVVRVEVLVPSLRIEYYIRADCLGGFNDILSFISRKLIR